MKNLSNRVQLIGRLGNDPEVKALENGKSLATFRIATNDYYVNADGERIQDTQWHSVVVFGRKVDIVEKFLKKGKEIAIEGKLQHRSYENGKGEKKYTTEVNLQELLLIGGKS